MTIVLRADNLPFSEKAILFDSHLTDDKDGNGVWDIYDEASRTATRSLDEFTILEKNGIGVEQLHVSTTGSLFALRLFAEKETFKHVISDVRNYRKYLSPSQLVEAFNTEEMDRFLVSLIPQFKEEVNGDIDLALLHYEYFKAALPLFPLLKRDSVKAQVKSIVHDYQPWYEEHQEKEQPASPEPASPEPTSPELAMPAPPPPSSPEPTSPPPPVSPPAVSAPPVVAPPVSPLVTLPPITGTSWTGTNYVTLSLPSGTAISQINGYGRTNWRYQKNGNSLKIFLLQTLPSSSAGKPIDFDIIFENHSTVHVNSIVKKSFSSMDRKEVDREISQNAGVLGAVRDDATLDSALGATGLDSDMGNGIGGLIEARGTQIGSNDLGARGSGLGGGGSAKGLGGLGTKGRGSGASGYGSSTSSTEGRNGIGIATLGNPIILGALDKPSIDAVIKRNKAQILYCYQRELQGNPSLAGNITVKFVIAKDGSVSSATTKTSTMGNQRVESCINGRFMKLQFPQPKGEGIVIVSYPFIFSPG